eukprot:CAMPEP_0202449810 /NCGR_PEP_ID=MMETSP1360-20130828/8513_1 /ASSEMBLY_ACC=CAM_ASM_000848 /TAXON_ID=515479 /ORGANISM="Licmophora paradoxa, Strain CCMP2313" /LENGTH=664 /DNA_ID=CAMNT_0049067859 /DNA_START=74 /DNA_END=2068 /DNA_ORIENTATION=+
MSRESTKPTFETKTSSAFLKILPEDSDDHTGPSISKGIRIMDRSPSSYSKRESGLAASNVDSRVDTTQGRITSESSLKSADPPAVRAIGDRNDRNVTVSVVRESRRRKFSLSRSSVERDARVKAVMERIEKRRSESGPGLRTSASSPVSGISITAASGSREKKDKMKVNFERDSPFSNSQIKPKHQNEDERNFVKRNRDPPITNSWGAQLEHEEERLSRIKSETAMESSPLSRSDKEGGLESPRRLESPHGSSEKNILERVHGLIEPTRKERDDVLHSLQKRVNGSKQDPPSSGTRNKDRVARILNLERKSAIHEKRWEQEPYAKNEELLTARPTRQLGESSVSSSDPSGSSARGWSPGLLSSESRSSSPERNPRRNWSMNPERNKRRGHSSARSTASSTKSMRAPSPSPVKKTESPLDSAEIRSPPESPRSTSSTRQRYTSPSPESSRTRRMSPSPESRVLPYPERQRMRVESPTSTTAPLSSPEKRRILGEFGEQTQSIRRQVNLALQTSSQIRSNHSHLSAELKAFRHRVSQHSSCKRGELEIMEACRSELDEFKKRVTEAREKGQDNLLSDSWDSLSDVRSVMLSNLKLMHGAKEALLHSGSGRLPDFADEDRRQLEGIQKTMESIRQKEKFDSLRAKECLADAKKLIKRASISSVDDNE